VPGRVPEPKVARISERQTAETKQDIGGLGLRMPVIWMF
jgi:hypothetical protein